MQRIDAIREIMKSVKEQDIVISSCGKISREVYHVKDRPLNFYVQGSMSSTLPIGIGIALSKIGKKVIVIVGDGEILMGLDNLVLLKKLQKEYGLKGLTEASPLMKVMDSRPNLIENIKKAKNILIKSKFDLDLYILDNNKYDSTGGQPTISDVIDFRGICDCKVIFCSDSKEEVPRIPLSHEEIKERFMNAIR